MLGGGGGGVDVEGEDFFLVNLPLSHKKRFLAERQRFRFYFFNFNFFHISIDFSQFSFNLQSDSSHHSCGQWRTTLEFDHILILNIFSLRNVSTIYDFFSFFVYKE